ncbi:hypothetical protein ACFQL0_17290 [Haloplanus litoreus]|uniref:Small CPxCG-related zinc finger protein n=1 Tax=Haloplanus litoreus TaxID=767515 RepID=A0ABD5ZXH1_9EURY
MSHTTLEDGDDGDASDSGRPATVYCPECGTRASAEWSFYRRCETSLDDAEPDDTKLTVRNDGEG